MSCRWSDGAEVRFKSFGNLAGAGWAAAFRSHIQVAAEVPAPVFQLVGRSATEYRRMWYEL